MVKAEIVNIIADALEQEPKDVRKAIKDIPKANTYVANNDIRKLMYAVNRIITGGSPIPANESLFDIMINTASRSSLSTPPPPPPPPSRKPKPRKRSCGNFSAEKSFKKAYKASSPAQKAVMTRSLKRACEDSDCRWVQRSKTCKNIVRRGSKSRRGGSKSRRGGSKSRRGSKSRKRGSSRKRSSSRGRGGSTTLTDIRNIVDDKGFSALTKQELIDYIKKTRTSALRRGVKNVRKIPDGLNSMSKTGLIKKAKAWPYK